MKKVRMTLTNKFILSYISAGIWAEHLDQRQFTLDNLPNDVKEGAKTDCLEFIKRLKKKIGAAEVKKLMELNSKDELSTLGSNFYLHRNAIGCGYRELDPRLFNGHLDVICDVADRMEYTFIFEHLTWD